MRPFTSLITIDDARQRLAAAVVPIDRSERVSLAEAAGRVAGEDIDAPFDVPPFARSVMDGYAIVAADSLNATPATPVRLRVVDRLYTGEAPRLSISPGRCIEIATGAPLPNGADAVVMVEAVTRSSGGDVELLGPATPGQNIGDRGSDLTAGTMVLHRGDLLSPGRLGTVAAIGHPEVDVYARPRVAILSTGNEVVPPGAPLGPAQVFDVNRFTLGALVLAHGGTVEAHAVASDSLEALERALDACVDADLIVFSGGSSVGEHDLLLDLVEARGEMIFHGIAIKPGKPTMFARVEGKPFFGMPGNPTSCLSNAYVLLVPFLRATGRLPPAVWHTRRVPLGRRIAGAPGRYQFSMVRIESGVAWPVFKGSGNITSLAHADGYIEIEADRSAAEGAIVTVILY